MLDAALPLHHRPARIVVLRQFAEDGFEIDLPIAQRTETPRPIDPVLVAAIHAGAAARPVLRILHMKRAHTFVIEIEKGEIVHLLQDHVARIVQNVGALVPAHRIEESLEGHAVVQILARMQLIADIDAVLFKHV